MTNSLWSVLALKSRGWGGGVESKIRARHSVLWVSSGKEFSLLAPLPKAGVLGPYCSASASRSPGLSTFAFFDCSGLSSPLPGWLWSPPG